MSYHGAAPGAKREEEYLHAQQPMMQAPPAYPPQQGGGYPPQQAQGQGYPLQQYPPQPGYPPQPAYPPQPGYPPQPQPGAGYPPGYVTAVPSAPMAAMTPPNGAPQGPEFLFPPQYDSLIRQGGDQGYPPPQESGAYPPPTYEAIVPYSHDFRGLGGARAPQIVFQMGGDASSESLAYAEVIKLATHVECNYSAAFISMSGVFRVPTGKQFTPEMMTSATFQLPQKHNSAVTNCKFWVGRPEDAKSWQAFDVSCLAKSDAQELAAKHPPAEGAAGPVADKDVSTFFIPVQGVQPGSDILVEVTYFERVESFGPNFELLIPLGYTPNHLPVNEMHIRCPVTFAVNAGVRNFESKGYQFPGTTGYKLISWSSTHQIWANQENPTRMTGQIVSTVPWPSKQSSAGGSINKGHRASDFVLQYTTVSETILGHVIYERAPPDGYDNRDTYALFLTPPTAAPPFQVYRRVVFMLDKSYSMSGEPLDMAKKALMSGLEMLQPQDMFAILPFSHLFARFPAPDIGFLQATPQNVNHAKQYVQSVVCDGGTDILGAVTQANEAFSRTRKVAEAAGLVDFCFMLTDGAVANERDVCKFIQKDMAAVRFLTFGVGGYVNAAFLRMMATTGRGFCDISLNPNCLYNQMVHLMSKANAPLMTDITVQFPGEMYPRAIPDLYFGSSVIVGGKLAGPLPAPGTITVHGKLPLGGGQPYSLTITPEANPYVPVHRLFVKTMLDDLTAEAWLTESEKVVEKVTDMSCNENMACAYTQQVAHPAEPPEAKGKQKDEPKKGKKGFKAKHAAAAVGVAAVGGAGIYLLASSGAFSGFGNVAATASNAPVIGAMGDALVGAGDLLGGAVEGVGDLVGGAAEGIGNAVGGAADGCGDCCGGACGDVCGPICDPLGNVCFQLGDGCKDAAFQFGDCCKDCGGTIGEIATGCVGNCGELATGCAGNCGEVVGSLGDVCGNVCAGLLQCLPMIFEVLCQILGAALGG